MKKNERNLTLLTDLYQLTMMQGYFYEENNKMAVFNVFYRENPEKGGYAIFAGLESIIDYVKNLRFSDEDIAYLGSLGIFKKEFLEYLRTFKFTGDIWGMKEGTIVFPNEVLLKVKAPMMQAQLVETAILNFINHQSLIATKASRVCRAAEGDDVMEFGLRRAQGPDAGIYGARAAIIGGCGSTSNVLASKMYHTIPSGTHAHSWIMSFDSELEAFEKYAELYPNAAILLVDTYNTLSSGVPNAIKVFKKMRAEGKLNGRYGIRLDSGDLAYLSKEARKMLDAEGFTDAIICASNDLDERLITSLKHQGAKINSWGVGTKLITSYDWAAFGAVYKLAEIEVDGKMVPKIKLSENTIKVTNPGNKTVFRLIDKESGRFIADLIALADEEIDTSKDLTIFDPVSVWKRTTLKANTFSVEELLYPVFSKGECVYDSPSLMDMRAYCKEQQSHIWPEVLRFENPHGYYVDLSDQLYDLKKRLMYQYSEGK